MLAPKLSLMLWEILHRVSETVRISCPLCEENALIFPTELGRYAFITEFGPKFHDKATHVETQFTVLKAP